MQSAQQNKSIHPQGAGVPTETSDMDNPKSGQNCVDNDILLEWKNVFYAHMEKLTLIIEWPNTRR